MKTLILPVSLQTLDSGAFNGLDGTQIYFQGETAPAAQADSFSENIGGLHIPAFSMEFDTEQWNTYDIPIAAEAYAICETDGNVYFQEQDGATLLTAAPDTVHFSAESLPGVSHQNHRQPCVPELFRADDRRTAGGDQRNSAERFFRVQCFGIGGFLV